MPLKGMTFVFAKALARSVKIVPIAALLKNALVAPVRVALLYAAVWLGKLPAVLKAAIC